MAQAPVLTRSGVLVCPHCYPKHGGASRIGNRKNTCHLCNRFAQRVRREVARALTAAHPEEAAALRVYFENTAYEALCASLPPSQASVVPTPAEPSQNGRQP